MNVCITLRHNVQQLRRRDRWSGSLRSRLHLYRVDLPSKGTGRLRLDAPPQSSVLCVIHRTLPREIRSELLNCWWLNFQLQSIYSQHLHVFLPKRLLSGSNWKMQEVIMYDIWTEISRNKSTFWGFSIMLNGNFSLLIFFPGKTTSFFFKTITELDFSLCLYFQWFNYFTDVALIFAAGHLSRLWNARLIQFAVRYVENNAVSIHYNVILKYILY